MGSPSKPCTKCRAEKSLEYFTKSAPEKDGRASVCKACRQLYYQANAEKIKAGANAWYAENKARARATRKATIAADPALHDRKSRALRLAAVFGITVDDYEALDAKQGGGCAICGGKCSTGRRLAVDHCHDTGTVRGLLCWHCNTGIGKLQDNPALLAKSIDYLAQHGKPLTADQFHNLIIHQSAHQET